MEDNLVDVVLDSAACGVHTVEREGISITHSAKFIMIGSCNMGEGEIRPQMLDRFGLAIDVETLYEVDQRTRLVLERMSYEADPKSYLANSAQDTAALCRNLLDARQRLASVRMSRGIKIKISDLCSRLGVNGLRGDLVTNRAAKALVAFEGRSEVTDDDLQRVIFFSLGHRLQADPINKDNCAKRVASAWASISNQKPI